jgi:hypothetical protein
VVEAVDRADVGPLVVVVGRPGNLLALTVDGDLPGDGKLGDADKVVIVGVIRPEADVARARSERLNLGLEV